MIPTKLYLNFVPVPRCYQPGLHLDKIKNEQWDWKESKVSYNCSVHCKNHKCMGNLRAGNHDNGWEVPWSQTETKRDGVSKKTLDIIEKIRAARLARNQGFSERGQRVLCEGDHGGDRMQFCSK